jgi:hypothetical protein
MSEAKFDFIEDSLNEWASLVDEQLKAAMNRMNISVTNDLYNSILFQVIRATAGHDGRAVLSFHEYGRFVDMGTGKGGRGKAVESLKKNRKAWEGRKPKKFYSKTSYGMLNRLIEQLIYGYQVASTETVKTALQ